MCFFWRIAGDGRGGWWDIGEGGLGFVEVLKDSVGRDLTSGGLCKGPQA